MSAQDELNRAARLMVAVFGGLVALVVVLAGTTLLFT